MAFIRPYQILSAFNNKLDPKVLFASFLPLIL